MNSDLIHIEGLELRTRIGVDPKERAKPQRLLCTLEISTDLSPAARTDQISDTINAQEVVRCIRGLAAAGSRRLLEKLAGEIADCILTGFKADRVVVTLRKFVLPKVAYYGIRLERRRRK